MILSLKKYRHSNQCIDKKYFILISKKNKIEHENKFNGFVGTHLSMKFFEELFSHVNLCVQFKLCIEFRAVAHQIVRRSMEFTKNLSIKDKNMNLSYYLWNQLFRNTN